MTHEWMILPHSILKCVKVHHIGFQGWKQVYQPIPMLESKKLYTTSRVSFSIVATYLANASLASFDIGMMALHNCPIMNNVMMTMPHLT